MNTPAKRRKSVDLSPILTAMAAATAAADRPAAPPATKPKVGDVLILRNLRNAITPRGATHREVTVVRAGPKWLHLEGLEGFTQRVPTPELVRDGYAHVDERGFGRVYGLTVYRSVDMLIRHLREQHARRGLMDILHALSADAGVFRATTEAEMQAALSDFLAVAYKGTSHEDRAKAVNLMDGFVEPKVSVR